jgi:hypothetical protein
MLDTHRPSVSRSESGYPAIMDTPSANDGRLRRATDQALRHWDRMRENVPAPVLRMLVMLPWLLRRMPVPFWVPVALMVVRRLARRRRYRRGQTP